MGLAYYLAEYWWVGLVGAAALAYLYVKHFRYVFHATVMLGDVAVLVAVAAVLYSYWRNPWAWLLCLLAFGAWSNSGCFSAWSPYKTKTFLKNAKDLGL